MKSVKPSSRVSKPASQGRLPARKVPPTSSRKPPPPASRLSSTGRHAGLRGISPSVKHGSPHSKKHSRSPKPPPYNRAVPHRSHGSPISVDRMHIAKRPIEYEKRRIPSRSPIARLPSSASRSVTHRRLSPAPHSRVRNRSESPGPSSRYSPLPKKKVCRDVSRVPPPPRGFEKNSTRMLSEAHMSHKATSVSGPLAYSQQERHFIPAHANRLPYPALERPREGGFDLSIRPKGMAVNIDSLYQTMNQKRSSDHDFLPDRSKRYGLTLDERFRSVGSDLAHDDQRVQFTREDLENITIDIKRSLRDFSPTVRRIVDPTEVKLVRRPSEGHRPIFDREEIKQAPRDMREDAYSEPKLYGTGTDRSRSGPFVLNYKEMENYEITRHRFENNHAAPPHSDSAHTLSEKWRRLEGQKPSMTVLDRDERTHGYPAHGRSPGGFPESRRMHRARSADRDFRPVAEHRSRPEYPPMGHKALPPLNPTDLRHSLAVRRKDGSVHDARERITERRASGREHPSNTHSEQRHYPGPVKYVSSTERIRERSRSGSRGRRIEYQKSHEPFASGRSADRSRLKVDKVPDYAPKPDRLKYQAWEEKSNIAPKGASYFEHDDREGADPYYSRGGSRGRGRSFRGRSFRGGPPRGTGFRGRGTYRSSLSPRGRTYPPKRGRYSPNRWKHDMFAKSSQDSPPGGYPARTR